MNKIWANRLIAGTQVWDSVPDYRKNGVKTELVSRVEDGEICLLYTSDAADE